jgi:hypothetical protein
MNSLLNTILDRQKVVNRECQLAQIYLIKILVKGLSKRWL